MPNSEKNVVSLSLRGLAAAVTAQWGVSGTLTRPGDLRRLGGLQAAFRAEEVP